MTPPRPRPRRDAAVTPEQMRRIADRDRRIFDRVKDLLFYDPVCGGAHPLREHQACRDRGPS